MNLNNSQIEWMLENPVENNKYSKILFFTIILSILLHSFLSIVIAPLFIHRGTDSSYSLPENKTIQVRISPMEKNQQNPLLNNEKLITDSVLDKAIAVESTSAPFIEPSKELQLNKKEFTNKTILIEDILDNINDYSPEISVDEFNRDSIIFRRDMREKLELTQKRKQIIKGFRENVIFNENNNYYEFSNIGGGQNVRVDGNCFTIPDYEAFSLTQKNWIMRGNCKKKKTWKPLKSSIGINLNKK